MEEVTLTISFDGVGVSADIAPYLQAIEYVDNVSGESDMLTLELDNSGGQWSGGWYPAKGSAIEASVSVAGSSTLVFGEFEIDEVAIEGPPDICVLRAMAAGVTKKYRLERSESYEDQTLAGIARRIAKAYALELVGDIKEIKIGRITQHRARDLSFLRNIAVEHGYLFSIRGNKLVFYSSEEIESAPAAITLTKGMCASYRFRDIVLDTYQGVNVVYTNAGEDTKIIGTSFQKPAAPKKGGFGSTDTGVDTLELRKRAEDEARAKAIAEAALREKNSMKVTGLFTLDKATWAAAGVNFDASGFGSKIDGKYHIIKSRHKISRDGGYVVEFEAKQV